MSDSRSLGMSPFLPSGEIDCKLMRTFRARDGAVYREHINRDGYKIIERSREQNVADRDTLSQCISVNSGPIIRPYMK
jgi:hypothetical protein